MSVQDKTKRFGVKTIAVCVLLGLFALIALADLLAAVWPVASGDVEYTDGGFLVDASHADEGYVMVKYEPCSDALKLKVTKGNVTYTYDLNPEGDYEVLPLQLGSGEYTYSLYRNVRSNKYSKEATLSFKVDMADPNIAFLGPSQYVDYDIDSLAVAKSAELCEGLTSDAEKLQAITDFMVAEFAYDFDRAQKMSTFYLGDIDGCLQSRTGLCQDLAALMACMLRVQGIPTQLVIGYSGQYYHAWNKVYIDGEYKLVDITAEINNYGKDNVHTEERIY